jgi:hypothetical protein
LTGFRNRQISAVGPEYIILPEGRKYHEALQELKSKNIELIDKIPRPGAGGSLIAFIHPESAGGILIELKQEKED